MDGKSIKELSNKKILNLSDIWEQAGIPKPRAQQRARRASRWPDDELQRVHLTVLDIVADVVETAKIDKASLIARLLPDERSKRDEILKIIEAGGIEPLAYGTNEGVMLAIFHDTDRYRFTYSAHKTKDVYMDDDQLIQVLDQPAARLTTRGTEYLKYLHQKR